MWERRGVSCLKWNGDLDALSRKKAGFPCSGLNAGLSFISQDEGMSESPVETLEKALGPHLFQQEASHPFDTLRGTRSSILQMVTKPDSSSKLIGIPISLWQLEREPGSPTSPIAHLSVPIALPSFKEIPEVSLVTRQDA